MKNLDNILKLENNPAKIKDIVLDYAKSNNGRYYSKLDYINLLKLVKLDFHEERKIIDMFDNSNFYTSIDNYIWLKGEFSNYIIIFNQSFISSIHVETSLNEYDDIWCVSELNMEECSIALEIPKPFETISVLIGKDYRECNSFIKSFTINLSSSLYIPECAIKMYFQHKDHKYIIDCNYDKAILFFKDYDTNEEICSINLEDDNIFSYKDHRYLLQKIKCYEDGVEYTHYNSFEREVDGKKLIFLYEDVIEGQDTIQCILLTKYFLEDIGIEYGYNCIDLKLSDIIDIEDIESSIYHYMYISDEYELNTISERNNLEKVITLLEEVVLNARELFERYDEDMCIF